MWEPAFGAGFQARWDGQQIFGQDSAIGPTERHFHSEPGILPILVQMSSLAAAQDQKCAFRETRAERTLLQIVVQTRFSKGKELTRIVTVSQLTKSRRLHALTIRIDAVTIKPTFAS
jgi:hypothetical protein